MIKVIIKYTSGRPSGNPADPTSALVALIVLGAKVEKRVKKGQTTTRQPAWGDGAAKFINPSYPKGGTGGGRQRKGAGLAEKLAGVAVYKNSDEFHRKVGAQHNTFNVSGGMWGGLTAVGGKARAKLQFMGRSVGQQVAWTKSGQFRKGQISNALKAASVRNVSGVNVLDSTPDDSTDLLAAATGQAMGMADKVFAGAINWGPHSETPTSREINRR